MKPQLKIELTYNMITLILTGKEVIIEGKDEVISFKLIDEWGPEDTLRCYKTAVMGGLDNS
jgi:hypothetical protein